MFRRKQSVRIYRLQIFSIIFFFSRLTASRDFPDPRCVTIVLSWNGGWKIGMKAEYPRMSRFSGEYVGRIGSEPIFVTTILSLRISSFPRQSIFLLCTNTSIWNRVRFRSTRLPRLMSTRDVHLNRNREPKCICPSSRNFFLSSPSRTSTQTSSVFTLHATRARRAECRRTNRGVCRRVVSASMCPVAAKYIASNTNETGTACAHAPLVRPCVRVSADGESNTPSVLVVCTLCGRSGCKTQTIINKIQMYNRNADTCVCVGQIRELSVVLSVDWINLYGAEWNSPVLQDLYSELFELISIFAKISRHSRGATGRIRRHSVCDGRCVSFFAGSPVARCHCT